MLHYSLKEDPCASLTSNKSKDLFGIVYCIDSCLHWRAKHLWHFIEAGSKFALGNKSWSSPKQGCVGN